jgi:hypothetical protein
MIPSKNLTGGWIRVNNGGKFIAEKMEEVAKGWFLVFIMMETVV